MTHVWIRESAGMARFVDDATIPPCNDCGERVSKCSCGQEEVDFCPSCAGKCRCDENYDRMREKENEAEQEGRGDE